MVANDFARTLAVCRGNVPAIRMAKKTANGRLGLASTQHDLTVRSFASPGFLQFFTTSFHGDREEVFLEVNLLYRGS